MLNGRDMFGKATVSVAALRATLAAAERLGLSRSELYPAGLGGTLDLGDPDRRVRLQFLVEMDTAVVKSMGPGGSALRLGEAIAGQQESIESYLYRSSVTLREFFEQVSRYRPLTMDVARPILERSGTQVRFGCAYPPQLAAALSVSVEKELAMWLSASRKLTRNDWTPTAVYLQASGTDPGECERLFRAPVHNRAKGCWLVFDSGLLELPIAGGDSRLLSWLRPHAERLLANLDRSSSFTDTVREALQDLMRQDHCAVEDVARLLAVSARTLQRRLEREGTTFATVWDETRRAAALECLRNPEIAIKEAAFRSGFSEPSTFYRAVRRWTGGTPAHYRRSLDSAVAAVL